MPVWADVLDYTRISHFKILTRAESRADTIYALSKIKLRYNAIRPDNEQEFIKNV